MKKLGQAVCAAAFVCLCAGGAAAQERGFVRVLGGATFGTASASSIFGAGAGVTVAPNVQILGEIGRMGNVMPSEIESDIEDLADLLEFELGVPVTLDVSAPAVYALGGVRFNVPVAGRVQPFVEGLAGVATLSFNFQAEVAGIDISEEIEEEAGIENETEAAVAFGGGISVAVSEALGVDVGYRYNRIFTEDPAVNASAVYAALTFKFR